MGETKHTPTPWRVEYKPAGTCIFSNEPNFLLLSMSYTQTDKTTIANAKRIVECVNALEGIDNPTKFINDLEFLNDLKGDEFAQAIRSVNFCKKYNELKEVVQTIVSVVDDRGTCMLTKDNLSFLALQAGLK
jgi:hypothetical protein